MSDPSPNPGNPIDAESSKASAESTEFAASENASPDSAAIDEPAAADAAEAALQPLRQRFANLYREPDLLKREYQLAQLAANSSIPPERFYPLFEAYCQSQAGEPESLTSRSLAGLRQYFPEIRATRDHRDRNYKLVQAANTWGISLEQCRALFHAYCHQQQNLPSRERATLWGKGLARSVVQFAAAVALLSQFTIVVGIVFYLLEAGDRKQATHRNAWETIQRAQGQAASFGRINALEDLSKGCKGYKTKSIWHTTPILRDFFPSCVDLRGLDVSGAYLATVDLRWAQLRDANLAGARLWSAQLQQAELQRAQLQQAKLGGAQLQGAKLEGAALLQADLQQANLMNANLKNAKLEDAKLNGAILERADLSGASLTQADFSNAPESDMTDTLMQVFAADYTMPAIAQGLPISQTNLRFANLSNANLSNANLQGADLHRANLTGVDLTGADLRNVENLEQADLSALIYDETTRFPAGFTPPP